MLFICRKIKSFPVDRRRGSGNQFFDFRFNTSLANVECADNIYIQGLTRMHELRHTLGHQLGDKGVRLEVIKNILGHSDIRTTERYVGTPDKASEDAMKALDGFGTK